MPADFDQDGKVRPSQEDIDGIEREEGPLPSNASIKQQAERWRLYQAAALIRLSR